MHQILFQEELTIQNIYLYFPNFSYFALGSKLRGFLFLIWPRRPFFSVLLVGLPKIKKIATDSLIFSSHYIHQNKSHYI